MTDLTRSILDTATVIDVRTYSEVDETGIYPGAIHIPLDELDFRLDELPTSGPLVLYCRSGNRSGKACEFLEEEGFCELYNGINLAHLTQL